MTRQAGRWLIGLVLPAVLIIAYAIWAAPGTSFFFPPLSTILSAFRDSWLFDRVPTDLLPSLGRIGAGFAISVVVGVVIGMLLGANRALSTAVDPILQFLRALPAPALLPVALLIFGPTNSSKIFLIVMGALWPVLLNTVDGVRSVEPTQLDMARSYQIPWAVRIRRVVLPAAMPRIFAGMRTSLALSIILMVVSELVASNNGLGYFVLESQRSFAIADMWGGTVLLGILGFVSSVIFLAIESRVLFWNRGMKASSGAANTRT